VSHERPGASSRSPTFDEELLLWLEDEPPEVRAADAERVRDANRTAGAPFERVWPAHKFG